MNTTALDLLHFLLNIQSAGIGLDKLQLIANTGWMDEKNFEEVPQKTIITNFSVSDNTLNLE